jgi:hypothetical protein
MKKMNIMLTGASCQNLQITINTNLVTTMKKIMERKKITHEMKNEVMGIMEVNQNEANL